jgi:hypothetical protein
MKIKKPQLIVGARKAVGYGKFKVQSKLFLHHYDDRKFCNRAKMCLFFLIIKNFLGLSNY